MNTTNELKSDLVFCGLMSMVKTKMGRGWSKEEAIRLTQANAVAKYGRTLWRQVRDATGDSASAAMHTLIERLED